MFLASKRKQPFKRGGTRPVGCNRSSPAAFAIRRLTAEPNATEADQISPPEPIQTLHAIAEQLGQFIGHKLKNQMQ